MIILLLYSYLGHLDQSGERNDEAGRLILNNNDSFLGKYKND